MRKLCQISQDLVSKRCAWAPMWTFFWRNLNECHSLDIHKYIPGTLLTNSTTRFTRRFIFFGGSASSCWTFSASCTTDISSVMTLFLRRVRFGFIRPTPSSPAIRSVGTSSVASITATFFRRRLAFGRRSVGFTVAVASVEASSSATFAYHYNASLGLKICSVHS